MDYSRVLNLYKPVGPTSHDMVYEVRRALGIKKVGHAGTLDPFAEGVLLILVGKATKRQMEFMKMEKEYVAEIFLGAVSDTDDRMGAIEERRCERVDVEEVKKSLDLFVGEIDQVPPSYSAVKIKGRKAYDIARKGGVVKLKSKRVVVYGIELLEYVWPIVKIKVVCGKGTYIRSLARDVGEKLGCGAYVKNLIRTRVGDFDINDSIRVEDLKKLAKNIKF
ncbi:MAG: tRNA pseudouridine(55) synthase TruB [Candidatus Portnoybacteria bacterium]|nr:tRNA pseudouridine(55) synthase TruB [Candidatus Portnoybacteria bacterium]